MDSIEDIRALMQTVAQHYKYDDGSGFAFDGTDADVWRLSFTGPRAGVGIRVKTSDILAASRCGPETLHSMIKALIKQVERAQELKVERAQQLNG